MAFGIVLAPNGHIPGSWPTGITMSRGGNGTYLGPPDPQSNTRGEAGFYTDTALGRPGFLAKRRFKRAMKKLGLGQIPTDAELATVYGYTPVVSGWIATKQGYLAPPWNPPVGAPPGGYPMPLGDPLPTPPPIIGPSVEEVMAAMNSHNDRIFTLALVSTTAVAVSALITVFRTLKLIREGA